MKVLSCRPGPSLGAPTPCRGPSKAPTRSQVALRRAAPANPLAPAKGKMVQFAPPGKGSEPRVTCPDGRVAQAADSSAAVTDLSVTFASSSMKSTTFSSKIGARRFSTACGVLRKKSSTACSWPG